MRRGPTWVAMLGVLAGNAGELACNHGEFACREAADCRSGSITGTCEPSGWCSFPDAECPSGQRYGGFAGAGLANRCVEPENADVTTAADGGTAATPSSSSEAEPASSDAAAATTADDSGSSDGGPSSCGNGELDADEACDDGNDVVGDGCNPDCVQGGEPLWSVIVDGRSGGFDGAFTIESYADGDLAVGVAIGQGDRSVPGVWRIDSDGRMRWSWSFTDEVDWPAAYTWGLAVTADAREQSVLVTATGEGADGSENALARVRGDGEPEWYTVSGGTGFGVAVDPSGELWTGGRDDFGNGMIRHYGSDGVLIDTVMGEPSSPATGFPYELLYAGGTRLLAAGIYAQDDVDTAYLRVIGGPDAQAEVELGVHNEALGLAYDPIAELDWVVGYAQLDDSGTTAGQGWIAALDGGVAVVEPRVITEAGQANLHGVAIDPSGAVVAVGWQSPAADRDPTVIKLSPDGEILWTRTYPGEGNGELRDVVVAADGAIFVVGQRTGADGTDEGWIARLAP